MTNEERAKNFWIRVLARIENALADEFQAVRLDEAEWWARPIESVEGIWRSIEEQRERIAALREGRTAK